MDEKNKLSDEVQLAPKQGSGSLLAAERKKQSRTVEEIADELNLSITQIRTIELDQSEGLPEPTYVRGYIRAYARLLGMDADSVLEHYLNPNWQRGSRLDDMPRGIGSANEREKTSFFTPAKIVAIIVVAAILGFLWMTGQFDTLLNGDDPQVVGTQSQSAPSQGTQSSSAQSSPVSQVGPGSEETTELNNPALTNSEPGVGEVTAPADSLPAQSINPSGIENRLSLSFSDTSWVDIRDGNGERLAYKSYAQGEDLSVSATTPMSVFIGNAKAVTATLNGDAYDISQFREGVFARFTIGK